MSHHMISPDQVPSEHFGSLVSLPGGSTQVRFDRNLAHPADRVWAAITDPAERDQWFPNFVLDLQPGGAFQIWFGSECDGPAHVTGTVNELIPGRVLQCGGMRYALTPTPTGCRLEFTDVLHFQGSRSRAEIINAVLGGWHRHTDNLQDYLDGCLTDPHGPEVDYSKVAVRTDA